MTNVWNYNETPLPVGLPVRANGSDTWYQVGFYDGALHADQYPDEPEKGVMFESPDAARAWLEAVTAVLTPFIANGDRDGRVPNVDGWANPEED